MPDLRIHREHALGLAKARKIAWKWAEEAEKKFDMECTVIEGDDSDTVEFTRSGVSGRLVVAADHFDLEAKLGFLLGAFAKTIEGQIESTLDDLLAQGGGAVTAAKTAAKPAKVAAKGASKGARAADAPAKTKKR
jgi:putative polyhydroxyalkanoate system protein